MNAARHLFAVPDPSDLPRPASVNELLAAAGRGSTSAFEELYDQIAGSVFGIALRVVRDQAPRGGRGARGPHRGVAKGPNI